VARTSAVDRPADSCVVWLLSVEAGAPVSLPPVVAAACPPVVSSAVMTSPVVCASFEAVVARTSAVDRPADSCVVWLLSVEAGAPVSLPPVVAAACPPVVSSAVMTSPVVCASFEAVVARTSAVDRPADSCVVWLLSVEAGAPVSLPPVVAAACPPVVSSAVMTSPVVCASFEAVVARTSAVDRPADSCVVWLLSVEAGAPRFAAASSGRCLPSSCQLGGDDFAGGVRIV
jgi:uncharacterized protein YaaQ